MVTSFHNLLPVKIYVDNVTSKYIKMCRTTLLKGFPNLRKEIWSFKVKILIKGGSLH